MDLHWRIANPQSFGGVLGFEELAAAALSGHLPDAVLDPIRMHVAAKRYLCFADPDYLAELSPASLESLALQGGPYPCAIAALVGLRTRRPDRRPAAPVEQLELDRRCVDRHPQISTVRVLPFAHR